MREVPAIQIVSMKLIQQALVAAMLFLTTLPAVAQERLDDVLADMRAHGYPTVTAAIVRLQGVGDVAGKDVPLARRAAYHRALLDLSGPRSRPQVYQASRAALQRMADGEGCLRCRFDLALSDFYVEGDGSSASEARLRAVEALAAKLDGADVREALLAAQAAQARSNGQHTRAIGLLLQASDLAKQNGDRASQLDYLADMVALNADLGDADRAIETGNEALRMAEALGYHAVRVRICIDMGHAYATKGDRPRQRAILERGLQYAGNAPDLAYYKTTILNNLADFWLSHEDYPRTLEYARQALALARETGQEAATIAPLANIGIAEAGMGRLDAGLASLRESIRLSKSLRIDVHVLGITQELVKVLQRAGRYREALEALQSIIELQEAHTRQARETAVLDLQEKYAAQRKSDEIDRLAAQNRLKQSQLEAEGWKQRLWLALAGLFALGALMLWQSIMRARKANRKLASANQTLALQSATDALTGAFNRRHAQSLLDQLQAQMAGVPEGQGFGLVLLDLDLFKRINDTRGHAAGDAVLVETVRRLREAMRQNDVVARWGGEEFVLVLPGTRANVLPTVAKKVLAAIGGTPYEVEGKAMTVTASMGAIGYPAMPGQSWAAALGLADSALYLAKASGRNQAVCVGRIDVGPTSSEVDLSLLQKSGKAECLVIPGPSLAAVPPGPATG